MRRNICVLAIDLLLGKMGILKLVNGPRTTPDVIFDIGTGTVRVSIVDEV